MRYDAVSSGFVTAVKYRNDRSSLGTFADGLALIYPDTGATEATGAAILTWAPTTAERRRSRGFDQARLMARQVGRGVGVRPRKLLRRMPGPQQTGRSLQDRLSGPQFECVRRGSGPVIVVDDVCTTGATLGAAATVLLASGFSEVHGLVLARTPVRKGPETVRS